MSTALTIFRREFRSFFDAPLAYVVAIAFLLINSGLFILDFWMADQVSLRSFFEWVSWSACFFIPAITMRAWAEERRGATLELLLTLPAKARSLVAGKFLAALAFYLTCLAGSLVLPACLKLLSTPGLAPDWGSIAAGYLGAILTGALLIALGLFLSALCRDQVEAYIVTLAVVILLRLGGFVPVASQLDAVLGGAGTFLRETISFATPLARATRGILALGDVLFFATWTLGLLALNAVLVEESRLGPGSRARRVAAVAM
jgi:ABC-type transport system involved in multi-copper enzyme maturation permease subunit